MNEHPWHSVDYLRYVAGRGRVVPVEVGKDYRTADWTQRMMSWDDFLDALEKDPTHSQTTLYMAQHNLFSQFHALREDILIPDYVFTSPEAPATYPFYRPPHNEEGLALNAWLGPPGTASPAHTVCPILLLDPENSFLSVAPRIRFSTRTVSARAFLPLGTCLWGRLPMLIYLKLR
jgi:lysine-specific demethylase 8